MVYRWRSATINNGFVILPLIFVLSFGFVGLILFLFISNKNIDSFSNRNISDGSTQNTTSDEKKVPTIYLSSTDIPLPPDITWEGPQIITKEEQNIDYSLYLTNERKNIFDKQYQLTGKLWSYERKSEVPFDGELPDAYYNRVLVPNGWIWGKKMIITDEIELTPMMADGPAGESFGYLYFNGSIGMQVEVEYIVLTGVMLHDQFLQMMHGIESL